jgi:hypothetical protein
MIQLSLLLYFRDRHRPMLYWLQVLFRLLKMRHFRRLTIHLFRLWWPRHRRRQRP